MFKIFLIVVLALVPSMHGFAQQPGTPSQPGSAVQQGQGQSGTAPSGIAPGAIPQPGVGNTERSVAPRQVPWGWLLFGFISGLIVGIAIRSHRTTASKEEIRRDRAA